MIENKFVNIYMKGKLICLQIISLNLGVLNFVLQLGLGEY